MQVADPELNEGLSEILGDRPVEALHSCAAFLKELHRVCGGVDHCGPLDEDATPTLLEGDQLWRRRRWHERTVLTSPAPCDDRRHRSCSPCWRLGS